MSKAGRSEAESPPSPARVRGVAAVLLLAVLWPLAQRGLVARYGVNPWKLGGFAMYATYATSLAGLFEANGAGGLKLVDESSLPPDVQRTLATFRSERNSWGELRAPDDVARAVFAARPELDNLLIVVQRLRLDPETARIASEKSHYVYDRSGRAG